jgi:hypothetical protein
VNEYTRVVNNFSDRKLSSQFPIDSIPIVQPLHRADIPQAFLNPSSVIKAVDIGKHGLSGLFSGLEVNPVYRTIAAFTRV